ncbi:MAG: rhamnulokinase family protein [Bacillota bacterium]
MLKLLAFDYGATSGRGMIANFDGEKLHFGDDYRFANRPVFIGKGFYWDFPALLQDMKIGIQKLSADGLPGCIGVDTWGVDYGLLDKSGDLLGLPYNYRDARTDNSMEDVFKIVSSKELYMATGIQLMQFNTIFQLHAHLRERPWMLEQAEKLLFMPDLLNYYLTGLEATEFSIASTSQMLNPNTKTWNNELLGRLNIPTRLLGNIVEPGTMLGSLSKTVMKELNVGEIPVALVAGHDTGSAVVAVPATSENYAYLSCGTWSLLGIESRVPIVTEKSYNMNFTNEGGIEGTYRVIKNIMGLWIQTECLRTFEIEGFAPTYEELEDIITSATPFRCFIDPDDQRFLAPGNMPKKVADYCAETGQYVPQTRDEILRCVKESLALKYRYALEGLEMLKGERIDVLHMVGGGIRSVSTCMFTASAIGRPVIAGPAEGTAIGNFLAQLIAKGEAKDLAQAREILRRTVDTDEFMPHGIEQWNMAYEKFLKVTGLKN